MPASKLIVLIVVFFFTALVSVVTGSTALITVPALITAGVEPHIAVATNMLTLVFLSLGGWLSFMGKGLIDRRVLPLGIILAIIGSGLGALLLVDIPTRALQLVIAIAMIAVALFSIVRRDSHAVQHLVSPARRATGLALTFLLAVYGGLFSGGYVTLLTAVLVFFVGLSFLQSVATTKIINLFSSLAAVLIFARRGLVDYRLGTILGPFMLLGAVVGAKIAVRLPSAWLRRVFVIAAVTLAANMLVKFFR